MESEALSCTPCDFGFAFNVSHFSDRILHIKIMDSPPTCSTFSSNAAQDCSHIACLASRTNKKRKANQSDADRNEDEAVKDCSTVVVRVKTLFVSSPILAVKSPFFYKLFSNGMQESTQRRVTLCIDASEEAAFMELLKFMYRNTLSIKEAPALLDVLLAADKFEVVSCMRYCSDLLKNLPMTPESALRFLDLPSNVLLAEATLPLTNAAKQFLATRYRDITLYEQEVMELPLVGIEAVLASNELHVASEDAVYDFVLKWARKKYPDLEERREILGTRLIRYIRFPFMTSHKLRKVLACPDFDHKMVYNVVLEALFFKTEPPHRRRKIIAEKSVATAFHFSERNSKYKPVKVVEFELPRQQSVVYLDLTREECANMSPFGRVYSHAFYLGSQRFILVANSNTMYQQVSPCFGLFLVMQDKDSVSIDIDYEFTARIKPSEEYGVLGKGHCTFTGTGGNVALYKNVFSIPWSTFMAHNSKFFINGILHVRGVLTIKFPLA